MGKKYIIEIEEGKEGVMFCQSGIVSIGLHLEDEESLRGLGIKSAIPYTEPDTEKVREEAYRQGYDKGYGTKVKKFYEQGLVDAWTAARKIVTMPDRGFINSDIIDLDPGESIFTKYTASEAIEKIRQYEQEKEKIQVGDEVDDGVANLIVLEINEDGTVKGFDDSGSIMHATPRKKTGRHFPEIAEVLRKMKENQ